jgi:hypothetical protein
MPQVLSEGNCQYTVLNTAGTTTLNPGQAAGPPVSPLVFFGIQAVAVGTAFVFTAYDIYPATPGGAAAGTNTLLNGTSTAAGQLFEAGAPGVGVRCKGGLVVVTSGTPGVYNALWD